MTNPMIRIHNIATDEIIDREMTDEEFTQYKLDQAEAVKETEAQTAKEAARAAVLEKLGLTDEEMASILP